MDQMHGRGIQAGEDGSRNCSDALPAKDSQGFPTTTRERLKAGGEEGNRG